MESLGVNFGASHVVSSAGMSESTLLARSLRLCSAARFEISGSGVILRDLVHALAPGLALGCSLHDIARHSNHNFKSKLKIFNTVISQLDHL